MGLCIRWRVSERLLARRVAATMHERDGGCDAALRPIHVRRNEDAFLDERRLGKNIIEIGSWNRDV
jgi:hypothetical protein